MSDEGPPALAASSLLEALASANIPSSFSSLPDLRLTTPSPVSSTPSNQATLPVAVESPLAD